jgi:hypothetical protein
MTNGVPDANSQQNPSSEEHGPQVLYSKTTKKLATTDKADSQQSSAPSPKKSHDTRVDYAQHGDERGTQ